MSQAYIPMIGLNVYLEPQFRKEVIEKVYTNIPELMDDVRRDLLLLSKEEIRIAGFRNPMIAPLPLRVKAAIAKFEKDSKFTKQILIAWADLHRDIHESMLQALEKIGFKQSETAPTYPDPENAFIVGWPEGMDYEKLHETLSKESSSTLTSDENALLSIWLTGCLP